MEEKPKREFCTGCQQPLLEGQLTNYWGDAHVGCKAKNPAPLPNMTDLEAPNHG